MKHINHPKSLPSSILSKQEATQVVRDENLTKIYIQLFQQKLLVAQKKRHWTQQVTQHILACPIGGQLALEEVAEKLNMTTRSLQRKLKQEDTTFLEIHNHIQFERAKLLLGNSHLNISEISDLLGYAEPSVFRRAFKRWTGKSPRDFLKNMKS